jgi:hypothetical protein
MSTPTLTMEGPAPRDYVSDGAVLIGCSWCRRASRSPWSPAAQAPLTNSRSKPHVLRQ